MRNYAVLDPVFSQYINADEHELAQELLNGYPTHLVDAETEILNIAIKLVESIREHAQKPLSVEGFLQTYPLSSQEGRALMCLAEALLRIPDATTQLALMRDKLSAGNWHPDHPDTAAFLHKAMQHTLSWTDSLLNWGFNRSGFLRAISSLTRSLTDPIIRQSVRQSMMLLGQQFVFGQTIEEALKNSRKGQAKRYAYDFDMLGEAAKTAEDAQGYFEAYRHAIHTLAHLPKKTSQNTQQFGVSIKLSALHPRYEVRLKDRVFSELYPKLCELVKLACQHQIPITLDAEEVERLELSLELLEKLLSEPWIRGWHGLGLAIQSYQKRAEATVDWVIEQARKNNHPIRIRLVKGAYWDTEIKLAQERGLATYPVFTEKHLTDLNYLICADKMFAAAPYVYPQFATHNAYTVAAIIALHKKYQTPFEFQRLHGMGADLYTQIIDRYPCRVYAPVGKHADLLAYLIRRLLENGANSSFVNKIYDLELSPKELLQHPRIVAQTGIPVTARTPLPLPAGIYPDRRNSRGLDITQQDILQTQQELLTATPTAIPVCPSYMTSHTQDRTTLKRYNPANPDHTIAEITCAHQQDLEQCLDQAIAYQELWSQTSIEDRAQMLEKLADLIEQDQDRFVHLLAYEAGKVLSDSIGEIREAVDFCRFYAQQARQKLMPIQPLPGPTGETNELSFAPRGVFVCISPWNFPLAIFLGQVTAALVSGNVVIAKPAMQTTAIAQHAVQLAYRAGIPKSALHLMPAPGKQINGVLLTDPRIGGVAFTGSTETARHIQRTIAERPGPLIPLIAETGGLNAMIVDASALPEQVVTDVVTSAFQSAGQRCSALRILYIQEDVKERICTMLAGAIAELQVGPPQDLATDIGPVVDKAAWETLNDYTQELTKSGAVQLAQAPLPDHQKEYYIAPQAWFLEKPEDLTHEIFGPILHIVTYAAGDLEAVLQSIHASKYGLTLGVHSRIQTTVDYVRRHARVGNLYINRNIIGAIVGSQPFGGEGLSGTGFKAGGPHYLLRFVTERAFCEDTTASGGNVTLLCE